MALGLQCRARAGELSSKKSYARSRLVDEHGNSVPVATLEPGETYLFHYPFVSTPCFLINLGRAVQPGKPLRTKSGDAYQWPGGIGPESSIVAFSAICAHKMTHPAKTVSFINYRPETVTYRNNNEKRVEGRHLIYCCSEQSVYDARDGARVLGGPASQPLTAIGLEYDAASDALFATGTYGGEMYRQYFGKFGNRLRLQYETTDIKTETGAVTLVQHMDEFTSSRVLC